MKLACMHILSDPEIFTLIDRINMWLLDFMVAHFTLRTNDRSVSDSSVLNNEYIVNLEKGDLPMEIANHSQRIFTLIQDNNSSIFRHQ